MPLNIEVRSAEKDNLVNVPPTLEDIQEAFDPPALRQNKDDQTKDSESSILFTDDEDTLGEIDEEKDDVKRQVIDHDEAVARNKAPDPPAQTEQSPEDRNSNSAGVTSIPQARLNYGCMNGDEVRMHKLAGILIAVVAVIAIVVWITISAVRRSFGDSATGDNHPSTGRLSKIGNAVYGQSEKGLFGSSLALSANGKGMAVGCFKGDLNGNQAGQVQVYSLDKSNTWQLQGQSLQGTSVALSVDGSLVAVTSSGYVNTFKFDGSSWTQQGSNLGYGTVVAVSADGQVIATSSGQGAVSLYTLQSSYWQQYGQTIVGTGVDELFGYSVALNSNGNVLAVGAPRNSDVAASSGKVRIFSINSLYDSWQQVGNDISGDVQMDKLGSSVALSADGSVFATGLVTGDQRGGEVRVYRYNAAMQNWTKVGKGATGERLFSEFGYSISLSSDGATLAAGAPRDTNNGHQYTGLVRVFEVTNDVWVQIGSDLTGARANDNFGRVVGLSGDGTLLVVAAPNASQSVSYDPQGRPSVGYVRTFKIEH